MGRLLFDFVYPVRLKDGGLRREFERFDTAEWPLEMA